MTFINMEQKITLETGIKIAAICGYLLIVISMFVVLVGAGVGFEHDTPKTTYQEYVDHMPENG